MDIINKIKRVYEKYFLVLFSLLVFCLILFAVFIDTYIDKKNELVETKLIPAGYDCYKNKLFNVYTSCKFPQDNNYDDTFNLMIDGEVVE